MNVVRMRERQRAARHEAAPRRCRIFLGEILGDVVIVEPERGSVTGSCTTPRDTTISAVVYAVGVLDGFGSEADELALAVLVPDEDARAEVLDVAAKVMEHPEFGRVRNALSRRLTFADRMGSDEIAKVANAAAGRQFGAVDDPEDRPPLTVEAAVEFMRV